MKNQNINQQIQNTNSESQAAQLALIAGLITTLGDGLAVVATALAIQEEQQKNQKINNNNNNDLQKQIDELSREVKQIKKLLRSKGF